MSAIETSQVEFDQFVVPPVPVKRWTVAEYHELIRLGVLKEGDPYELIEGWLVTNMTKGPPHDFCVNRLGRRLNKALDDQWCCRTEGALTLADGEPEPDISVAVGPDDRYRKRHPGPSDVALIIEVSDATLARDQGVKLRSYARAGIAEYWIVNLIEGQVEVYTKPVERTGTHTYESKQIFRAGESIAIVIDGKERLRIDVSDIC